MSRRPAAVIAAILACGALVATSQVLPASATPAGADGAQPAAAADAPKPPKGKAWLVGVITDQAGHPLQDVNVEAWPDDPDATEPTASDLTYENLLTGKQGYYRLEVPIHASYRIVVSADTEDPYRTFQYNDGDPIKAGTRKVRKLGTSEIARVALQPSKTTVKAKPATVKAGKTATLTVTVLCKNVEPVTGKVAITLDGKKVKKSPFSLKQGTAVVKLAAPKQAGKHDVEVSYLGDPYVKKSATKLTLTVKK
jgi:hypothetical protein